MVRKPVPGFFFRLSILLFGTLPLAGCFQSAHCDTCYGAAMYVKVAGQAGLPASFGVSAIPADSSETAETFYDSLKHVFNVQGRPGKYLLRLTTALDTFSPPDIFDVEKVSAGGECSPFVNTLRLEISIRMDGDAIEGFEVLKRSESPGC